MREEGSGVGGGEGGREGMVWVGGWREGGKEGMVWVGGGREEWRGREERNKQKTNRNREGRKVQMGGRKVGCVGMVGDSLGTRPSHAGRGDGLVPRLGG